MTLHHCSFLIQVKQTHPHYCSAEQTLYLKYVLLWKWTEVKWHKMTWVFFYLTLVQTTYGSEFELNFPTWTEPSRHRQVCGTFTSRSCTSTHILITKWVCECVKLVNKVRLKILWWEVIMQKRSSFQTGNPWEQHNQTLLFFTFFMAEKNNLWTSKYENVFTLLLQCRKTDCQRDFSLVNFSLSTKK